ncbi:MAG: hypothetical protein HFF33_03025 [Oscillospiraceae bacterium]|nr:hypothetical protein [Oscillospiraceae bacterium]
MELQVIAKQEEIPAYDKQAIKLQNIRFYDAPYDEYEGEAITEALIAKILGRIPNGLNIYLSLDLYGEDDWLEVNCDGTWLALSYCSEEGQNNYYSYNPAFADTAAQIAQANFSDKSIYSPLESGGQTPIPKIQALTDVEQGLKAVEYFIRTGELYPGIDWLHEF